MILCPPIPMSGHHSRYVLPVLLKQRVGSERPGINFSARPHPTCAALSDMRLTIGVMGSSGGDLSEANRAKAHRLGEAIAARDAVLITGGCPGLAEDVETTLERIMAEAPPGRKSVTVSVTAGARRRVESSPHWGRTSAILGRRACHGAH
jgi:hypothetical protein